LRLRDLSLSEYLDCVWALKVRVSGAMMNPFEYRDLMNVAFGYSAETIKQVKDRYDDTAPKRKAGGSTAPSTATASTEEMSKLKALLANGKPRPPIKRDDGASPGVGGRQGLHHPTT